jgi:hypothetical protein
LTSSFFQVEPSERRSIALPRWSAMLVAEADPQQSEPPGPNGSRPSRPGRGPLAAGSVIGVTQRRYRRIRALDAGPDAISVLVQ